MLNQHFNAFVWNPTQFRIKANVSHCLIANAGADNDRQCVRCHIILRDICHSINLDEFSFFIR